MYCKQVGASPPTNRISKINRFWRMPYSGMWRHVDLVLTDVSEERIVYIFRVEKSASSHLLTLVPLSRIFLLWRWRWYVSPKRRFTQGLYGATSQKTAFFIVTAVKTSSVNRFWVNIFTPWTRCSGSRHLQFHTSFHYRYSHELLNSILRIW
jgi:hypothetical protein